MEEPQESLDKSCPPDSSNEKNKDIGKSMMDSVFNEMPEPIREKFLIAASHYSGPVPNPIFQKITPDHITSVLDTISKDDDHSFKLKKGSRFFNLIYVIVFLGFICFLICFLIGKNPEFLTDLFYKGMIFLGGAGGGYGYKAYRSKKK